MSLCYDFQKWLILSLALVAVSLTIGLLIQYTHGQEVNQTNNNTDVTVSIDNPLEALFSSTNNSYYSIDVPDNWTYRDYYNGKDLTPREFGEFLLNNTKPLNEKMKDGGYTLRFGMIGNLI